MNKSRPRTKPWHPPFPNMLRWRRGGFHKEGERRCWEWEGNLDLWPCLLQVKEGRCPGTWGHRAWYPGSGARCLLAAGEGAKNREVSLRNNSERRDADSGVGASPETETGLFRRGTLLKHICMMRRTLSLSCLFLLISYFCPLYFLPPKIFTFLGKHHCYGNAERRSSVPTQRK